MLVNQKIMFDRYYCIKSFCHLKTLEKTLRKVHFCITLMAGKTMKDPKVLKTPVCKVQKPCINST